MARRGVFLLALLWVCPAFAQESTSYRLKESVFNAGGDPYRGSVLSSASYRIRLDAVGDSVAQTGLQGPSFHLDGGFVSAYPPPTEIAGLRFLADKVTLRWDPEKSVGAYNLYRDLLTALARSEEHTSELQSPCNLVCRLLLEKKKKHQNTYHSMA